jgi:hypothetical protein
VLPSDLALLATGGWLLSRLCCWLLPYILRVSVEAACYFRHRVSMYVLRFDHHASDTVYVCWIPSPRRAVSRLREELMVGRPNRRIQSSFIVVSGSQSRAPSFNR